MIEYRNSDIIAVIDEYIHDELHRRILKRRYVDHLTYERLAEEFDRDVSTIRRIIAKTECNVFHHLR